MKFLCCLECGDVLALRGEARSCACGASSGRYIDRLNAEISGPSLALGFANSSFMRALRAQISSGDLDEAFTSWPYEGEKKGREFIAFIIPESAATVRRADGAQAEGIRRNEKSDD